MNVEYNELKEKFSNLRVQIKRSGLVGRQKKWLDSEIKDGFNAFLQISDYI